MTKEEFAISLIPGFEAKWEIYNSTPEKLIGRKVVAVRSGFGCGPAGGTVMVIDSIKDGWVRLKDPSGDNANGWATKYETCHLDFKFINK